MLFKRHRAGSPSGPATGTLLKVVSDYPGIQYGLSINNLKMYDYLKKGYTVTTLLHEWNEKNLTHELAVLDSSGRVLKLSFECPWSVHFEVIR